MNKKQTKKGAASIYAVVFATLLIGIVAISFVRVILRGAADTTDNELSQSSRDAALVGIEDAKRAINEYKAHPVAGIIMEDNCDFVKQVLENNASATGEVLIQETTTNTNSKTEQAYTCVQVSDVSENYKRTLTGSNTVAVVPLSYDPSSPEPNKVEFSWYAEASSISGGYVNENSYKNKPSQQDTPSVVSFQYVQTDSNFYPIEDFDPTRSDDTDTATIFLTPKGSGIDTTVSASKFAKNHNIVDAKNDPIFVNCNNKNGYRCSVEVSLPKTTDGYSGKNRYLVVSLPYGAPETAFMVKMKHDSETVPFRGVQYVIDSTGRANNLYTRLEVRLDTVDPNFPYPQFALQTEGDLNKAFWVTDGCKKVDNGAVDENCPNSGNL